MASGSRATRRVLAVVLSEGMTLFSDEASDAQHFIGLSRCNAGITKVYTRVLKNFIIYDSRVAVALGWLVATFCTAGAWGTARCAQVSLYGALSFSPPCA